MIEIAAAEQAAHYAVARTLFVEYGDSLGVDLSFQGFAAELEGLEKMYAPPGGCLLLAWRADQPVGCVGVRALSGSDCEMKRLYVRDVARGSGLGRALAQRAMAWAKSAGYRRMCLDTLAAMTAACRLYGALGFHTIEPYYQTPLAGTAFMAIDL
jgi:GNAT superfamily N-acetyltransferase